MCMKPHVKIQAIKFRESGWSYNVIAQRLHVSKSTLSHWLREIPYSPNATIIKRVKEGPLKSAILRNQKKLATIASIKKKAASEIDVISKRDLFMLGLGLYIGEGTKLYENIRLINSDPDIIKLGVMWFNKICGVPRENFSMSIHIYPDIDEKKAQQFWSKITGIPLAQFAKVYIDRRENKSAQKKRKLPYGTAHLSIKSKNNPDLGVALHRKIMGWIETIYARV